MLTTFGDKGKLLNSMLLDDIVISLRFILYDICITSSFYHLYQHNNI